MKRPRSRQFTPSGSRLEGVLHVRVWSTAGTSIPFIRAAASRDVVLIGLSELDPLLEDELTNVRRTSRSGEPLQLSRNPVTRIVPCLSDGNIPGATTLAIFEVLRNVHELVSFRIFVLQHSVYLLADLPRLTSVRPIPLSWIRDVSSQGLSSRSGCSSRTIPLSNCLSLLWKNRQSSQ